LVIAAPTGLNYTPMTPVYTYDKDVDILYISFSPGEKATTAGD